MLAACCIKPIVQKKVAEKAQNLHSRILGVNADVSKANTKSYRQGDADMKRLAGLVQTEQKSTSRISAEVELPMCCLEFYITSGERDH